MSTGRLTAALRRGYMCCLIQRSTPLKPLSSLLPPSATRPCSCNGVGGRLRWSFCRSLCALSLQTDKGSRSRTSRPILPSSVPIETSRIMLPDDANPNSNVHGGTILKLIDQAGNIVATRHCNRSGDQDNKLITVLARVEHTDFHQPMRIAEVSQVQAAVTFTSKRSMEVMVDVWAENLVSGERRHTNSATLWYVATLADAKGDYPPELKPMPIPPMTDLALQEKGMQRYENQKRARMAELNREFHHSGKEHEHYTVGSSRTTLANLVLPSDCYRAGYMMGGPLMKMMDSAAAICAAKHCHTQAVTASLEAINFISPVMNGEVVFVTAELIFTSTKSMEIELLVEAEGGLKGGSRRVTNTAHFTFVSLGKDGHAIAVPPLKVVPEKKERFEEGRKRYENRKRLQKKKLKQL